MPPLLLLLGLLSAGAHFGGKALYNQSASNNDFYSEKQRENIKIKAEAARKSRIARELLTKLSPQATSQAPTPVAPVAPVAPAVPAPQIEPTLNLDALIRASAGKYGYHPRLFDAIIATETGNTYNPRAYRAEPKINDASYGLGQILGKTALGLGYQGDFEGLYDPATSIDYIGRYLESKQKAYPKANFNDPLTIYRIYNTGNPYGTFAPGAQESFTKKYESSKRKSRYGAPE